MKNDAGTLRRILRIMNRPDVPGVFDLYRYIEGVPADDAEIVRVQATELLFIKHRQPPLRRHRYCPFPPRTADDV